MFNFIQIYTYIIVCYCFLSYWIIGWIYRFVRRIRDAIYGEVIYALRVIERSGIGLIEIPEIVAIKRLDKSAVAMRRMQSDPSGIFKQEDPLVELSTLLLLSTPKKHPSIVHLIELLDDGRNLYEVMEFAGQEMFSVLCESPLSSSLRFDEAVARKYFFQILDGVEFIHKKGVVHLDLSLENIMLSADRSSIKIIDFGLARAIPCHLETGEYEEFVAKAMMPTNKVFYISPELYAMQSFDGEKCDIWSLGAILFIMLTGSPAFGEPTKEDPRFTMIAEGKLRLLLANWGFHDTLSPEAKGKVFIMEFCLFKI